MGKGSSGSTQQQATTQNVNNTTTGTTNSTTSGTSVQKADPYAPAAAGLNNLYGGAQSWFNSNAPTVASINPDINNALSVIRQHSASPSGLETAAQNAETGFLNGSAGASNPYANANYWQNDPNANGTYLQQNNPYLSGMVEAASRPIVSNFQNAIAPSLMSQFSAAGRTGSGANLTAAQNAQETLGRQLGDTSANIYGNAYAQERGIMANASNADRALSANAYQNNQSNMLTALGLAPTINGMRAQDANNLLNAGMLKYQLDQNQLDAPLKKLNSMAAIMQTAAPYATQTTTSNSSTNGVENSHTYGTTAGNMSGSGTQTAPNNRFSSALGGAATGAMVGSVVPGIGTAVGAGVGFVGGLFG